MSSLVCCLRRVLRGMGEPVLSCPLLLVLPLLFFFSTTFPCFTVAQDSIAAGQFINDTQTLTSTEGRFELGFFTPGRSKRRYLGIWYKRVPNRTVVWVANRLRPLPGSTGVLTMFPNGTLALTDASSAVYWSAGTAGATVNPLARLLDDGNFVLLDAGRPDTGSYAYQSFDDPADTMLPGMRLGVDLRTGHNRNITMWRSEDDPGPGVFSFGIDPRGGPQLVVANATWGKLWRGGPWVGDRFTGIPEMKANNIFNYGFINSDAEVYFKFDVWNKSQLSRMVVNQSGSAQHYVWEENGGYWNMLWQSMVDICDRAGDCGPNSACDATKSPACSCLEGFKPGAAETGCVREEVGLECRNGTDDWVKVGNVKLPDTSGAAVNASLGLEECRAVCLRNCSCTAFTSGDGIGCIAWFGDLLDIKLYAAGGGQDLYVRVPAGVLGTRRKNGKRVILIIILVTTVSILLLLLVWMRLRVRRRRARRTNLTVLQDISGNFSNDQSGRGKDFELHMFHLSTMVAATEDFSFRNKLGEGGFGPVYKGKLQGGQLIAVKRLSTNSGQGLEEFKSEVGLVAKLQHTNLVRLLGCCIEAEEKILVYEYMPNQSLDKFIFDPMKGEQLDWTKRFNIIEGIVQGLLYLHKYSRLRVIHRDLKASNILLDDEWNPKISDFGMARIFTWNDAQENTKRIVGTYGYMPPEYAMKGLFSVKSDVFSFGILLLEILSGKRNTSTHYFGLSLNLSGYAWKLWKEGRALEVMDPKLANTCSAIEISRCIHVALLCVQENPGYRPTTLDVVSMLKNESIDLPAPNRPAYYFERYITNEDTHFEIEGTASTNDATFSEIQAR